MYKYYWQLRNDGKTRIPAARETFKKFIIQEDKEDIEKQLESFIRQSNNTRI